MVTAHMALDACSNTKLEMKVILKWENIKQHYDIWDLGYLK